MWLCTLQWEEWWSSAWLLWWFSPVTASVEGSKHSHVFTSLFEFSQTVSRAFIIVPMHWHQPAYEHSQHFGNQRYIPVLQLGHPQPDLPFVCFLMHGPGHVSDPVQSSLQTLQSGLAGLALANGVTSWSGACRWKWLETRAEMFAFGC